MVLLPRRPSRLISHIRLQAIAAPERLHLLVGRDICPWPRRQESEHQPCTRDDAGNAQQGYCAGAGGGLCHQLLFELGYWCGLVGGLRGCLHTSCVCGVTFCFFL